MSTVTVPVVAAPEVSVVMVTYGRWDLCLEAITALVENTDPVYQLIVVDNAFPDGTADHLRDEVTGATLILNDRNVGFGLAANQGALCAVGRHLCFLNSDAFVLPGWLGPLMETMDDDDVAAVAPCFLNPDGSLQEAGALIDGEAVARSLGYGEDPDKMEYRFRRTVDFAAGACLLVRRRDFTAIGGFDPAYGRAYYEDVDLCFALARAGRRTVYEPRSRVVHVRGGSGTVESAVKLILANREVFFNRWCDEIAGRALLDEVDRRPHILDAVRDVRCPERVLVIRGGVYSQAVGFDVDQTALRLEEMAALWPSVRITLLVTGLIDHHAAPLLAAGVEVADAEGDWEAWLERRRFHYSAVVLGAEDVAWFDLMIRRTQPQAEVVDLDAMLRIDTVELMSRLGVAPPLTALERRWREARDDGAASLLDR